MNSAIGRNHGGDWCHCSADWGAWDFRQGDYFLQVKQAAARQSWDVGDVSESKGRGVFHISPNTGCYGAEKWISFDEPRRIAQIYVFGWHDDPSDKANHFSADEWKFFVVPSHKLSDGKRTISVNELERLTSRTQIDDLRCKVEDVRASVSLSIPDWRRKLLTELETQSRITANAKITPPSHSATS